MTMLSCTWIALQARRLPSPVPTASLADAAPTPDAVQLEVNEARIASSLEALPHQLFEGKLGWEAPSEPSRCSPMLCWMSSFFEDAGLVTSPSCSFDCKKYEGGGSGG